MTKAQTTVPSMKQSEQNNVPTMQEYMLKQPYISRIEGGRALQVQNNAGCSKAIKDGRPLVSVITAVRNGSQTIDQCIRSVLNQTYSNIEYIVIDGGSADDTVDILKGYGDKITYWLSEPDEGISDAFNKGVSKCKGEIIGILNADDWYEENAVNLSVQAHMANPEIGFTYGGCVYVKDDAPVFVVRGSKKYEKEIYCTMPNLNHPSVFVKRQVYEEVGLFSLKWRLAMDYEFLLRCHLRGFRGLMIPDNIAYMRLEGASDLGIEKALHESWLISRSYNRCPIKSYFIYKKKLVSSIVNKMLWSQGLGGVAKRIRNAVNQGYSDL